MDHERYKPEKTEKKPSRFKRAKKVTDNYDTQCRTADKKNQRPNNAKKRFTPFIICINVFLSRYYAFLSIFMS